MRLAKNTTPLSANVGYKSDVFLLWIEKEGKRKYQKIFPPKRAKDVEEQKTRTAQEIKRKSKAGHALNKASFNTQRNVWKSNNSAEQQISEHRRSPRSVESRPKVRSSVNDVEDELDSLVDEIFVKDFKPTSRTPLHEKRRKPHLQPKRMQNTHKILEHILKQEEKEEEESSTLTGKEGHSHGGTPKTITKTKLSTQEPGYHGSPRRTGERLTHLTLNNGRKQGPTTLNLPTRAITKKPRLARILKGNRITNKKHPIAATTKTTTKLSHRKRVEEFTINSPSSRTGDGGVSNIGNRNIKDVKERQARTTMSSTERSLNTRNQIHDITPKQSTASSGPATINSDGNEQRQTLSNNLKTQNKNHDVTQFEAKGGREAAIEDKNNDGRGHILTGTFSPKLYDNRRSNPTTKMINSKKVENIVIPGKSHGNGAILDPTLSSPTIRARLQSGHTQKIKSLPTTKMVSDGRKVENIETQTHVRDSSDIHQGIFTTTKNISSLVTSPTLQVKNKHNRKTISENIDKDNSKSTEKSLLPDSDSAVPGRVLAPHPGFTLPAAESTKTPKSETASVHAPTEHHIPITIEGMTDMKTENMVNKLRAGKDIIVMPTKSPVTRLTTGGNRLKSTEEKREIDNKPTQTTTQRHTDNNTNKQLSLIEPTQSRQNNSAPTHDGNRQLDLGNTNMIRNAISTPSTSPSAEGVYKNTRGLSNTKPTPEPLSEINHTEIPAVKKPTKGLNVWSSLGKSDLQTKLKVRYSVLLNARTKKVNVDDDGSTGKSHISHSVKLNGTKVSFRMTIAYDVLLNFEFSHAQLLFLFSCLTEA